jgi:hypothetical protein
MRQQNGIEISNIFVDNRQTPGDFAAAQPGIDQNARTVSCDERRIPGARRCQNADL